jgi:outer membrane protein assembly factor BamB
MRLALWFVAVLVCVSAGALSSPSTSAQTPTYPEIIALPNGWLPEGIATGSGPEIFAGSRRHGAIYRADLRTGEGAILVPPQDDDRIAVGLSYDSRSRFIFAASGPGGALYVYDARTGQEVGSFQLATTSQTFINDVIVTRDAAYVTDSMSPVVFRIPLGSRGQLPAPDAVNSTSGVLYSVDPLSGNASLIDLGGYSVTMGDGLLLTDSTLYVVRNRLNIIAQIELSLDLSSGSLVQEITNEAFDVPTTAANFGGRFYAVNARFTSGTGEDLTYSIVGFTP